MLREQTDSAFPERLLKISTHLFTLSVAEEKALSALGSLPSLSFAPSMFHTSMSNYEVTLVQILIKEATYPPHRCGSSLSKAPKSLTG